MKDKLDSYFNLQQEIFEAFGYVEDWSVIPLSDHRDVYWKLDGKGPGDVEFAESIEALKEEDGENTYSYQIWTNRHLPKWVYVGPGFTMICADTQTDGNKLLAIFDNEKRIN